MHTCNPNCKQYKPYSVTFPYSKEGPFYGECKRDYHRLVSTKDPCFYANRTCNLVECPKSSNDIFRRHDGRKPIVDGSTKLV